MPCHTPFNGGTSVHLAALRIGEQFVNLRIQILDHNYFWRRLNSRALPEPALPQLHPLGATGSRASTMLWCPVYVLGRQEENGLEFFHPCLFMSQGPSSHKHWNILKPVQNSCGQPYTNVFLPFTPSHFQSASFSPLRDSGNTHSLASQISSQVSDFPPSSEAKKLPPCRGSPPPSPTETATSP